MKVPAVLVDNNVWNVNVGDDAKNLEDCLVKIEFSATENNTFEI